MSEFVEDYIRADYTSISGPALGVLRDEIHIAWTDPDGVVNIMPVNTSGGSMSFVTEWRADRLGPSAACGPALAQGDGIRDLAIAWAIDHPELQSLIGVTVDSQLNIIKELVSFAWTDYSPSMQRWIREVNLAWTGSNNRKLNVAPLVLDESGWTFSPERTWTSDETETSGWEPSLGWRLVPNRLYIAWTDDDDNALNMMYCQGAGDWEDPPAYRAEFDRATRHVFTSETSSAGPALLMGVSSATLAYRGNGNRNLNLLRTDLEDYSIISKRTSGHTTPYRPAIISHGDGNYIAYTGEDDHLYFCRVMRE